MENSLEKAKANLKRESNKKRKGRMKMKSKKEVTMMMKMRNQRKGKISLTQRNTQILKMMIILKTCQTNQLIKTKVFDLLSQLSHQIIINLKSLLLKSFLKVKTLKIASDKDLSSPSCLKIQTIRNYILSLMRWKYVILRKVMSSLNKEQREKCFM